MRASAGCSRPRVRCSRGRSTCSRTSSCGSSGGRNGRRPGCEYEPTQVRRDPRGRPRVGVRLPVAEVARGRRVRRALVVGDGAAGPRDGVRRLGAGRARRVRGGARRGAAGGAPAHAVRRGERPVRAEPVRGPEAHAGGPGPAGGAAAGRRVQAGHRGRLRRCGRAADARVGISPTSGDRARGLRRAFIDVSGDMAAIGTPPGEPGWLVEIADPDRLGGGARRIAGATRLRDAALATAANTESIVRYGSLVAGHVMDPATGWPARPLKQATVVTRSAVAADALSTAMLVTGRRPAGVLKAYSVQHT